MNLAPIYELRSRLRTAMIAGTNLISEDFRLKRATEDMKPLESLSPVFARIVQLTDKLLSDDCEDREGALLDAITLVDALLCTQGQVAVAGDIEPITAGSWGSVITSAPYSVVKTLVEALTTSGNGHYQFVMDTHEANPELFQDYRIKSAMVAALGAGYAELAEQVTMWLKEEGEEIVPLLQKNFDPKGKKEMVRRLQVMEAVAGGKCNDFYVRMLPEAERDVKNELIYVLRHNEENKELLLQLVKKEKGNAKKMAYFALASIEDGRAEELFRRMYEDKPIDAMSYLSMSSTGWASKMVGECLIRQLALCGEPGYGKGDKVFSPNETEILRATIEALPGKSGSEICEAFRTAYRAGDIYYKNPKDDKIHTWEMHVPRGRVGVLMKTKRLTGAMAYFLEEAIRRNPDRELCALAGELYGQKSADKRNIPYFSAVLTEKLLSGEDCTEWLRGQLFNKGLLGVKRNSDLCEYLVDVLKSLVYVERKEAYMLQTRIRDAADEAITWYEQPVTQDIGGSFTDLLMEYSAKDVDREFVHFINPGDRAMCEKLEDFFYKRTKVVTAQDCRFYWAGLRKCGCRKCEGLLTTYLGKNGNAVEGWNLYSRLWELPGTAEAFEQEAQEVCRLIKEGRVKIRGWNEGTFLQYVENVKEKKRLNGC